MSKHRFIYNVQAEIQVDMAIIDYLCKQSSKHYDSACIAAGQQYGFLYGWRNQVEFAAMKNEEITIMASFHELDTLAKMCEPIVNGAPLVYRALIDILKAINAETEALFAGKAPAPDQTPFTLIGVLSP